MAKSGYAPINGLEMYYEIHGQGQPLVMIPGAFGIIDAMGPNTAEPLLSTLAATRQVIAVELQACGHTADIGRPFSFEQFADDIGALIDYLELKQADVLGYSMGGGVALQTAIRHSNAVRKLVVVSAPYKRTGLFPEVRAGVDAINVEAFSATPLYETYQRIAPNVDDWPQLVAKTRTLLASDFDWTQAVATLETPTLIALGDADSLAPAHAAEMFALLGGGKQDGGWDGENVSKSRLAILPATTHYHILSSSMLAEVVASFLDAV